jgi:hypothetical protein
LHGRDEIWLCEIPILKQKPLVGVKSREIVTTETTKKAIAPHRLEPVTFGNEFDGTIPDRALPCRHINGKRVTTSIGKRSTGMVRWRRFDKHPIAQCLADSD